MGSQLKSRRESERRSTNIQLFSNIIVIIALNIITTITIIIFIVKERRSRSREKQESAAYATVSVRQCCHLVNTFEVAAIECLTWVAT